MKHLAKLIMLCPHRSVRHGRRAGPAAAPSRAMSRQVYGLVAVRDAIDGAGQFIGYEDRAIVELGKVDQPTDIAQLVPSFSKTLDFTGVTVIIF